MNTLSLQGAPDTAATIIPNEFLDSYMPKASGDFVKIYLYFLRYCSCPNAGVSLLSAADTFCMTENDILRALKYWEREGLMALSFTSGKLSGIRLLPLPERAGGAASAARDGAGAMASARNTAAGAAPLMSGGSAADEAAATRIFADGFEAALPADDIAAPIGAYPEAAQGIADVNMYNGTPAYTARQMEHFKKSNDDQLFFVIEQYLGKPLGPTDVNKIVYFGEQLGFSSDLIEYLFEYCVSNNHYSIHYIEKTALAWARDGIDTVAKAKQRCTYYNKTSFDILKAFGISNRNPAPSEMEHIRRWTREYGFPMPIILEACRRTIEATHNPSFAYAEKILKGWYENNVGSMDDIKKLDEAREQKRQEAAQHHAAGENGAAAGGQSKAPFQAQPQARAKNNRFHNFEQRSYDYGQLEQALLKKYQNTTEGGN